jgi:L-lactate transport
MGGIWQQRYVLVGDSLGWSAALAIIPTLLLLYLLAVKRKPSWIAALSGLGAALVLALVGYRMSPIPAVSSALNGACFGLFPISWIVFWALVLYEISVVTGKFEIIKESIGSVTSDKRIQALLIAFAFGAFIEGCAGFGTPVAVAAAMMVGLGFSSLYASSICMLADTAPVAFGSIGIPIITLAGVTGLSVKQLSAMTGRLTFPFSLCLPAYIVLVTSGFGATAEIWPAVVICGVVFAGIQFTISNLIGPQLADILSSLCAMGALVLLLQFWRPRASSEHTMSLRSDRTHHRPSEIWGAWLPYILLVIFVLLWGYPGIAAHLDAVSVKFPWPGLHNQVLRMPPVVATPSKYGAIYTFSWLSASGTSAMLASLLSAVCLRMSPRALWDVITSVAWKLIKPTVTVSAMLAMAYLMNYSGATGTLGLAFAATGKVFPFFSPLMGWLGVFLTGSDTSSNALFGNLQVVSAGRLGLDPVLVASANSVGGVMGKMISLQSIAVAAAATGMPANEQAQLFRFTLRHSILLAALVGVETMLYAYVARPH